MVIIVLVRHGESTANVGGVLAGRTPGVVLTEAGRTQARGLGGVFPCREVTELRYSPLERCVQTTGELLEGITAARITEAPEFLEVDYGRWSGRTIPELAKLPEWEIVQQRPSEVAFPGGERLAEAAARAVAGVRAFVADLQDSGAEAPVGVVVAHGDIIKAVLADALGMPLDDFQRIAVAPGSFSQIVYPSPDPGTGAPTVTAMSVTAPTARGARTGEAGTLGGGA